MPRFWVKDKYTYEKTRQTDFSVGAGSITRSQNRINGRFIYTVGEEFLRADRICADGAFKSKLEADFSDVTGFAIDFDSFEGVKLCTVDFYAGDKSHRTVFAPDAGGKLMFDTSAMDFKPEYAEISVDGGELINVSLKYCCVLDTLGEYGGQACFYNAEEGELSNDGGVLKLTFSSQGILESPEFPDSSKTVYNMLMPRRNTVYAIIANKSTARTAKLYYTTTECPEYSEDGCVEVRLAGELPKAYYFNLSATKNCHGRMKSFKLVFEGDGEIDIIRYTFEQEKKIERTGGKILSCVADKEADKFCVKGTVNAETLEEYADGTVKIYAATMADDNDTPDGRTLLGQTPVSELFTIDNIPLSDGVTTYLPYQFLAFVCKEDKWLKLADRFVIENYADFDDNPYQFILPDYEVNVLNCGAEGDGITNDTDAIQAAIDLAAKMGGGRVTVPGDDSFYGRRYIITNLLMRSGVELHIDKGAVLWQSQLKGDYCYEVTYGHDGEIPGINWTHCLHVCNLPTIQAHHVKRIKITGFGAIRSMDTGSEEGVDMPGYSTGCPDRIHQIPLGFYDISYAEFRDFEIIRSNNYHNSTYGCDHVSFMNIKMHQVKCVSGDGIGLAGSTDIFIDRCYFQSNDDAVTLDCCYHDPRGILWWTSRVGADNSVAYVDILHCYLNSGGGKAIAFITWGTSDPIQERQEVHDINVHDCYLTCVNPVGTWPDNPYGGKQPFDNTETDDYSPVRAVRISGNRYNGNCTLGPIHATDTITDCGIHSWCDFRNGDFTLGGFANWNVTRNSKPESAETIIYADKEKGILNELGEGRVSACQGLYLECGSHEFSAELMTGESGAVMYVTDVNGYLIAERKVSARIPTRFALSFELCETVDVYVGVRTAGSTQDGFVIFDACEIHSNIDREANNRRMRDNFMAEVAKKFVLTDECSAVIENGKVYLNVDGRTQDTVLEAVEEYENLTLTASLRTDGFGSFADGYGYIFGADKENGTGYMLKAFGDEKTLKLLYIKDGKAETLYARTNFYFTSLDFHLFSIRVIDGKMSLYIDGSLYTVVDLPYPTKGYAGISFKGIQMSVTGLEIE